MLILGSLWAFVPRLGSVCIFFRGSLWAHFDAHSCGYPLLTSGLILRALVASFLGSFLEFIFSSLVRARGAHCALLLGARQANDRPILGPWLAQFVFNWRRI